MRFAALALMAGLAGCSLTSSGSGGECRSDSQCGDEVCARSGECLPRSSVREAVVKWTVNGGVADQAACASHPDLYLQFDGKDYGDVLRFAPVLCRAGSFFIDKLPTRYEKVELGAEAGASEVTALAPGSGSVMQAQFDLFR
jgi:hypothetical protein